VGGYYSADIPSRAAVPALPWPMVCFHCADDGAVEVDAAVDAGHDFAPQCGECRRTKVPVVKGKKKKNAKAHAVSKAKARKTAADTNAARAAARQPVASHFWVQFVKKRKGKGKKSRYVDLELAPGEKISMWSPVGFSEILMQCD
jgi:hypothetical protein